MWNTLKRIGHRLHEILNPGNDKALLEFARVALDEALAQLAQAEIDLADKAFYVREFAAVSAERDGLQKRNDVQAEQLRRIDSKISPLMAELADLRERASVPVKVRFTCSTDEMLTAWEEANFDGCTGKEAFYRDYLATHAVIDAPAVVDPPAYQVEALARVLMQSAAVGSDGLPMTGKIAWMTMTRAAIAHLAKRPEGLPTAEALAKTFTAASNACYWNVMTTYGQKQTIKGADAILAALRPWLRDPVGCELDVTESELHDAERDRLAAENAELKSTDHYQRSLDEIHLRYNVEAELAAANDTLDRLREVLAKWMAFDAFNAYDAIGEIRAILYPPENET